MKKQVLVLFVLLSVLLLTVGSATASAPASVSQTIVARLQPVGNSGVSGVVGLAGFSNGGTEIAVLALGLQPGETYVSLYYDNHTCELEPYSPDDVVGSTYQGHRAGTGITLGDAEDDLDEINSVSVRRASDFHLLACADVHPGG
jgi:hypothetical protein